jgi:hypothetical protein
MKEQSDQWKETDTMIEHIVRLCEQSLTFRTEFGKLKSKYVWLLDWMRENQKYPGTGKGRKMYLFQNNKYDKGLRFERRLVFLCLSFFSANVLMQCFT